MITLEDGSVSRYGETEFQPAIARLGAGVAEGPRPTGEGDLRSPPLRPKHVPPTAQKIQAAWVSRPGNPSSFTPGKHFIFS